MNYIIQDNFFNDPDNIRKYALSQKYYTKKDHPEDVSSFPGYRTDYLHKSDLDIWNKIRSALIPYISKLESVDDINEKYNKFNLQLSFSYTSKNSKSFRHIDSVAKGYKVRYGGLVYLYPKPLKKQGTTLYLKNTINLENKYNRLVLYKSNIEHEPTNNFGSDINNSRLVLTIFYDMGKESE